METEVLLMICSTITTAFILGIIIVLIIWLLINRERLKQKTKSLKLPIVFEKSSQKRDKSLEKTETDVQHLKDLKSEEDMEKLNPVKLMTWNDDDNDKNNDDKQSVRSLQLGPEVKSDSEDKMTSIELRKRESQNYIIFMPPLNDEQNEENESDPKSTPEVAFENDPQIGPEVANNGVVAAKKPGAKPIVDEDYTLEEL